MIYEYECSSGHRTERERRVAERQNPVRCPQCHKRARLAVSLPARPTVYANDRNGGQKGPGRITFGGPAARARWAKEQNRIEIGNDIDALSKLNETQQAEAITKRKKATREFCKTITKEVLGASGESIEREFDRKPL